MARQAYPDLCERSVYNKVREWAVLDRLKVNAPELEAWFYAPSGRTKSKVTMALYRLLRGEGLATTAEMVVAARQIVTSDLSSTAALAYCHTVAAWLKAGRPEESFAAWLKAARIRRTGW